MVVMYTELALRQQQFHMAPATQQPNGAVSTSLWWILKTYLKVRAKERLLSLIQNYMRHERSESAQEQRIALYESDQ